jgi:hypothetical protein
MYFKYRLQESTRKEVDEVCETPKQQARKGTSASLSQYTFLSEPAHTLPLWQKIENPPVTLKDYPTNSYKISTSNSDFNITRVK